ncbi:MAG TPA: hypothetical protein VFF67_08500 [Thermoplasmata archaeon]|nr:hypothetical protein [Thermoplasmata archaeon]
MGSLEWPARRDQAATQCKRLGKADRSNAGRWNGRFAKGATASAAAALALLMAISPTVGALKPHLILPPDNHTALAQTKSISVGGN